MYNDNDFITVLKVKTIHIGFHSQKTDLNQISKVTYEKTFKIVIQGNQDHSHFSVVRPLKKPLNGQCSRIVEFACDVLYIYLSEPLKVKVKQKRKTNFPRPKLHLLGKASVHHYWQCTA